MPIVSKTLDYVRPQRDGTVRVRERHTDSKGRHQYLAYQIGSEAEAVTNMNARDLTAGLEDTEEREILEWVQARNTIASFAFVDITEERGEEHVVVWFAENSGGKAITVAWWIESLNPPSWTAIANRIGYDAIQRSEVQDRAIDLVACEVRFDQTVSI